MIEIILAIITLLSSCGWFVSGRKHRHEVRKAKAEAEQVEFNLSVQYVQEFKKNISEPLEEEIRQLRNAIKAVGTCEHRADCPVMDELQSQPSASGNGIHNH